MKVLICGAGIGGLTTALCCLQRGHDVMVFEQASELGEVGAGIQVPPNAMKVFEHLGIAERIAENAVAPQSIEARMGKTGRRIFSIPLAQQSVKRWGAPYLHLHRADYISALEHVFYEKAPKSILLDAAVTGYAQTDGGVSVQLANGRKFEGEILIGADGIHSVIREQMLGPDKPSFTGNVAWRAAVPIDALGDNAPNPTACAWFGKGRHAVTYRLRQGKLVNFVGVVERDDWMQESWTEPGDPKQLQADFRNWHPVIADIIKAAEPSSLYRWALFDRSPLARWTDNRVALLGDAAHPMLPFLAQGAAMATEDAWCLAHKLGGGRGDIPKALKAYEKARLERTSKVQAASRANMNIFHKRTRLSQILTYGPMWLAGHILPGIVHSRMDWLYGYDVTQRGKTDVSR